MESNQIIENTQALIRKDLLLDSDQLSRKDELIQNNEKTQSTIDTLKRDISIGNREIKGISLFENGHVTIIDDETSLVLSENGKKEYLVNCINGTCQCKDHEFTSKYGVICGHRIADKLARKAIIPDEIVTFASLETVN